MKKRLIRTAVSVGALALVFGIVMGGRGLLAAEGQQEESEECRELIVYISEDDFQEGQQKETEEGYERPASASADSVIDVGDGVEWWIHCEGRNAD